jgi:K+/H+ antiporter YhaU regulatory subunit KhtT
MRSEFIIPGSARINIFCNQGGEITIKKVNVGEEDRSTIPEIVSLTPDEARQISEPLKEIADYCDEMKLGGK